MKYSRISALLAALAVISCSGPDANLKVVIENDGQKDRSCETIELDVSTLSIADMALNENNIVILDKNGAEVPSQIYKSRTGGNTLVFQAGVRAGEKAEYYIAAGNPGEYGTKAYSRYVPERFEDYAYENDVVAGRIYGPSLEDPRTQGSDIWIKCTPRLIVDEWFAKNDYHHNYGDGMDCYKVGNTLGGGAIAPLILDGDGQHIMLTGNYATWEHLTDGPVRTAAFFTYGPFEIDGISFTLERELVLDTGSHFVKHICKFVQNGGDRTIDQLPVVIGAVKHDVKDIRDGEGWIAFTEKSSDTKDPDRDGDISVGIVLGPRIDGAVFSEQEGHAAFKCFVPVGRNMTFWTGSAWSQGNKATVSEGLTEGSHDADSWAGYVSDFGYCVGNPLKITIEGM